VQHSSGAHIWIIGNEMNFEREQPRQPGSNQAEPITPRRYAQCYSMCRDAIRRLAGHRDDQIIIGGMGPWNAQTPYEADPEGKYPANKIPGPGEYPYNGFFGDFIIYLRDILLAIGRDNCDGIALHAYSHGYDPKLVTSEEKMGPPFQKYNYHFRTYRDQMNIIPQAFRDLPVYITEANGDREPSSKEIWPNVNRGWIKNAYQEINDWNERRRQQIRAVVLFRWPKDHEGWGIDGKQNVQQDLREAVAMGFKWNPDAGVTMATTEPTEVVPTPAPGGPRAPYRTRYSSHTTPTSVAPGQTLNVSLTVQNVGGLTWPKAGQNPIQLAFQWYNAAGQMVAFPPQLDFHNPLPNDVPPDGTVTVSARLRTPDTAGNYILRWDLIHEGLTWFTSQGDQGLLIPLVKVAPLAVEISAPTPTPAVSVGPAAGSALIQIQDVSATLLRNPAQAYPNRALTAINKIILHHTVTPPTVTVQRIAEVQVKNQNAPGIRCHYGVNASGQVFQTQPLELAANHAGNFSGEGVGIYLIGDFTNAAPPPAQLDAVAALLAQLALQLRLSTSQIFGYSDLVKTGSPGATWPTWKGPLIAKVANLMSTGVSAPSPTVVTTPVATPTPQPQPQPTAMASAKAIEHYLLFWHRGPANWARWDILGALTYLDRFPSVMGFSIEEAKAAKFVTIIGGPGGVPAEAERILQAAGCKVERIAGATETETRQTLEQLAAQGRRFKSIQ
jgi:hypothetical protein